MVASSSYEDCQYYPPEVAGGAPFRYATKAFGGFCAPDSDAAGTDDQLEALKKAFYESTYGNKLVVWSGDIYDAWYVILIVAVISLFLGYLYLFVIRVIGGAIIWVTFVLLVIALLAAGIYSYVKSGEYDVENDYHYYLQWAAYALWGLDVVVLILMCCCYNAIKLGIAIFKTTSMYVQHNLKIFALPGAMFFIEIIWATFWIFCAVYIFSVGEP